MGEENNNKDVQNNADQSGTQGSATGAAGTQQNNQQVSQQQTQQQQTTEKMFSQAQVNHMMANEKKQFAPNTDTTILEHEIDQLVYQIYGLTEEEIVIIEESCKQK